MNTLRYLSIALLLSAPSVASANEDARAVFESIYGERVRQASFTPATDDDLQLARELIDAARASTATPELLAHMCENASSLAMRTPAGYDLAIEAMLLLAEEVPARRGDGLNQAADIAQRRFNLARGSEREAAADALIELLLKLATLDREMAGFNLAQSIDEVPVQAPARIGSEIEYLRRALAAANAVKSPRIDFIKSLVDTAMHRQRALRSAETLRARLTARPDDRIAAQELARVYVVDLDSPSQANTYSEHLDEPWKTNVALAVTPIERLSPDECMTLGDWYASLADGAAVGAQANLLNRALDFYEAVITAPGVSDLMLRKAQLAFEAVNTKLLKLTGADATWTELLEHIDPQRHGKRGQWRRLGDRVGSQGVGKMAALAPPVVLDGDYQLDIRFVRTEGEGPVLILLAVGDAHVCYVVGAPRGPGNLAGLEYIDNKRLEKTSTIARNVVIENGKEYRLQFAVRHEAGQATIQATLGDLAILNWSGETSRLSPNFGWPDPTPKVMMLGGWEAAVEFRSIKMRMTKGQATKLD